MVNNLYECICHSIDKKEIPLSEYKDKVLLIVNTASECRYTDQYKGLEELYAKYKDRDFVVLGFPCNQFGEQEPADEHEIKIFCSSNYQVSFPMFSKVKVNGHGAHPMYTYLKSCCPGREQAEPIKWNFTKFLIDRCGKPVKCFAPEVEPHDIASEIEAIL